MEKKVEDAFKKSIGDAVEKTASKLAKSGDLDKSTSIDVRIDLTMFLDNFVKGDIRIEGTIESNEKFKPKS